MSGIWALVPVKTPEHSKTRLASVLQPQECASLSRAMFMDVLNALGAAAGIAHIAVLTDDDEVAKLTKQLGYEVIRDQYGGKLCEGLNAAAKHIADQGADAMLVIPGDIPTISSQDIEQLLKHHLELKKGSLSLCPAIRDGGTNALVCSPPDAMPFQYGVDSARRHLDIAEQHGLHTKRLPMQAFFRDIDIPDDLVWLSHQDCDSNTMRFLRQSGIFARLSPGLAEASA
jgi:2-phospho-L-lactate guanylyltransferase